MKNSFQVIDFKSLCNDFFALKMIKNIYQKKKN